jgi:hypothetical protein
MLYIGKMMLALLGLTVPGYLSARLLRLPAGWVVAFPFSALLLTLFVILFTIAGTPLRFSTMGLVLSGWSGICFLLFRLRKFRQDALEPEKDLAPRSRLEKCQLGFAALIVMAVACRSALYPLSGFDTFIRWDALARLMLQNESLSYYPPVSATDFAIYLLPDGIPPLVASVYWWLYAALGTPLMQSVAIPVTLQLLSAMALVFLGTLMLYGRQAAYWSLLTCASSSLIIRGFAVGQDTGYTSLAVVGQFCFATLAVRRPHAGTVVAAAMFAALGALARDYGPALALTGFLVLAWQPHTRRYLWLFCITTVVLSAPWYLRSWVVAGNPLYPRPLLGLFPSNDIYEAPQQILKESFSFYRYSLTQWLGIIWLIVIGAPLATLGGIPFAVSRWRETGPLLITSFLLIIIWLLSMGVTGDAGAVYSTLLITPVFVVLAIYAGAGMGVLSENGNCNSFFCRVAAGAVLLSCTGYALACSLAYPFPPRQVFSAMTYRHSGVPEFCSDSRSLAEQLEESTLPAGGILTSNAYLGVILQQETRFRPVMTWSPSVKFVFDGSLDASVVRKRLQAENIHLVYLDYGGGGAHNQFFRQFPFFKGLLQQKEPAGFRLVAASGNEALYAITDNGEGR